MSTSISVEEPKNPSSKDVVLDTQTIIPHVGAAKSSSDSFPEHSCSTDHSDEDEDDSDNDEYMPLVDCCPLPNKQHLTRTRRKKYCYGFYADRHTIQKAAKRKWEEQLKNCDEEDFGFFNTICVHFQWHMTGYMDYPLHLAYMSQEAKDQIPEAIDNVDEHVIVMGLFKCTQEGLDSRPTQIAVDYMADCIGHKPIWWEVIDWC